MFFLERNSSLGKGIVVNREGTIPSGLIFRSGEHFDIAVGKSSPCEKSENIGMCFIKENLKVFCDKF